MQYIPFSVIKSIHEQTHSAMPERARRARAAPSRRRPLRAVRRMLHWPAPKQPTLELPALAHAAPEQPTQAALERPTQALSAPHWSVPSQLD
ncbi:hypothetical protein OG555_02995 [Kribbella sp. NBC_01484]|uniref:hypothetical protein n=1 Tax=Kribbella sp. NBC_01484 TaxID=2903579 RepID=UPI002E35BE2D|nr:hypothetical protein [Kribbella sp. NBC_01484]